MTGMPRPATAQRAPLTRGRILAAALRLIDERGLDELTMRALGAELGVEAMSIYKHVPGKGAVLDGVVELLLDELDTGGQEAADWDIRLTDLALRFRRLSRAHPAAFPLLRRRSLSAYIVGRAMTEQAMRTMVAGGFDRDDAISAMRTVLRFTLGFALSDPRVGAADDGPALESPTPLADEYPMVAELVARVGDPQGEDRLFAFGLAALIRGLAPAPGAEAEEAPA